MGNGVLSGTCICKRLSCGKVGGGSMRNCSIGSFDNSEGKLCDGTVMDMMNVVVATAVVLNGY